MTEYLTKNLRDRLNLLKSTGDLADFPFVVHGTTAMENYLGKPITTMQLLIERESLSGFLAKHGPDFYHQKDSNGAYCVYGILDGKYCEIYTVTPIDTLNNLKVSNKIEGFKNIRILSGVSTFINFVTGRNGYTEVDIKNLIEMDEKYCVIKNYSLHPEFSIFRYYLSKAKHFDKENGLPVIEMKEIGKENVFGLTHNVHDCTIYPGSKIGLTNNRILNGETKEILLAVGDKLVIDEYIRPSFVNSKQAMVHHHAIVKKIDNQLVFDIVDVDTFNEKPCTYDIQSLSNNTTDLTKSLSDSICNLFGIPKQDYINSICFFFEPNKEMINQKRASNNPLFNELPRNSNKNLFGNFNYSVNFNCLELVISDWTTNTDHLTIAMNEIINAIGGKVYAINWVNGKYPRFKIEAMY